MPLVKVKPKFQITLPAHLRHRARISVGDYLEAEVDDKGLHFRAQRFVDRDLAEWLEDLRAGRVHGPFDTADELIASLRASSRTRARKRSK